MFLYREIDVKRCQNYTKTCVCKILYKIRNIKQIIFNKYKTNLKTTISEKLWCASIIFEFNNFSILIDIIDNVIFTYYVWTMSPALQPMAVQNYCHMPPSSSHDQNTALLLEGVLVTWDRRISYIYMVWYNFDTVLC